MKKPRIAGFTFDFYGNGDIFRKQTRYVMKIQCPNCHKITELEHVDHGSQVECVCSFVFTVDESTVTEEFTEIDSVLPEWIGQYKVTGFIGFGGMGI